MSTIALLFTGASIALCSVGGYLLIDAVVDILRATRNNDDDPEGLA